MKAIFNTLLMLVMLSMITGRQIDQIHENFDDGYQEATKEWNEAIQEILNYRNIEQLQKSAAYSGSNINSLGNYDSCVKLKNLHYVLVGLKYSYYDLPVFSIGIWLPKQCNETSDFDLLSNFIQILFESRFNFTQVETYRFVEFPEDLNSQPLDEKAYVMIIVLVMLISLSIIGTIVHFTSWFDIQDYTERQKSNLPVQHRK